MPDLAFLAKVKAGQVGVLQRRRPHRSRHFADERVWRPHYVEGLVTYPGAANRSFIAIELTEKGEALIPSPPSSKEMGRG